MSKERMLSYHQFNIFFLAIIYQNNKKAVLNHKEIAIFTNFGQRTPDSGTQKSVTTEPV